ncbi:MAG: tetratricopeptide repeat protein [Candidatus Firestonebacteria bacterium]
MRKWALSLILITIVVIVFLPCLNNGFTNLDDDGYVIKNPDIRELSINNIKKIFSSFYLGNYHPLTLLSYSTEYYLFKLNPTVYHLTNLVFHLFNVLLVFWLIFLICDNVFVSFIVSLLFGIHPLHVESVAWIAERKDVLYSFFFFIGLICYVFYLKKNNIKYYFLSLFVFILSLLSKGMAITFPLLILLLDYFFSRKFSKKILLEKIPFFLISIIFSLIGIFAQYSDKLVRAEYEHTLLNSLIVSSYGLGFYLFKFIFPIKLSCFYQYPSLSGMLPFIFIFLIIAILIIILSRKSKKVVFGSLFFIISILPVLQILPLGAAVPADRYTYIPFIGLFYILGESFYYVYLKKRGIVKILLLVIFIILSFLTYQRCKVWKDSLTLWKDVLVKYPNSAKAFNSLGIAYNEVKKYDNAILCFNNAVKIKSDYLEVYNNRGIAYFNKRDYNKAISDYETAKKITPDIAEVYKNLGDVYGEIGEFEKAILEYGQGISLKPNNAEFYNDIGIVYSRKGDYENAIFNFDKSISLNPNLSSAYNNKGITNSKIGEYDKAISDYTRAIILEPDRAEFYNNRGIVYGHKKEYNKALEDYSVAIKLRPDSAEYYNNRGVLYTNMEEYEKAILDYNKAIKLNPNYLNAYKNKESTYKKQKGMK